MNRLNRLTSLALAASLATAASAADLPTKKSPPAPAPMPAPAYNWTGFYAGVNAGGIWGSGSADLSAQLAGVDIGGVYIPTSVGSGTSGWLGGGELGYNAQVGSFVWGVETDLDWVTNHKSVTFSGAALPAPVGAGLTTTYSARQNWLGTTRARLGIAATPDNRLLLYVTGGLAYGGGSTSASATTASGLTWSGSHGATQVGWTAGLGGAYAFTNNISVKAEYLYYNLGSYSFTATPNAAAIGDNLVLTSKTSPAGSIARVGLDYKF
jgi:outer membrane immunogenic protein